MPPARLPYPQREQIGRSFTMDEAAKRLQLPDLGVVYLAALVEAVEGLLDYIEQGEQIPVDEE
jgi:hypothetical protein